MSQYTGRTIVLPAAIVMIAAVVVITSYGWTAAFDAVVPLTFALLWLVLLVLACWGAGELVCRSFLGRDSSAVEDALFRLLVGTAVLMAEYNGVDRAPHVREKLAWLTQYAEATEVIGLAACEHCVSEPDSDLVYPNPMFANIAKMFFADNWHKATKLVQDIAGGIVATAPSGKDFENPETHDMIKKYLGAKAGVPTEHRLRLVKLIRDFTSSYEDVLTLHAEGSLAAQILSIYTLADFDRYRAAAKRAARIKDGTEHPLFKDLPDFPPSL